MEINQIDCDTYQNGTKVEAIVENVTISWFPMQNDINED